MADRTSHLMNLSIAIHFLLVFLSGGVVQSEKNLSIFFGADAVIDANTDVDVRRCCLAFKERL